MSGPGSPPCGTIVGSLARKVRGRQDQLPVSCVLGGEGYGQPCHLPPQAQALQGAGGGRESQDLAIHCGAGGALGGQIPEVAFDISSS